MPFMPHLGECISLFSKDEKEYIPYEITYVEYQVHESLCFINAIVVPLSEFDEIDICPN